jgi:hypothetical protein
MGIASDMKSITDNIMTSYNMRIKAVGNLIQDTHDTLKDFATDRKAMGEEQSKNLTDFMNGLSKNVFDLRTGFRKNHKKMSNEQEAFLKKFIKTLSKNVDDMQKDFQKDHQDMSDEQAKNLTNFVNDLTKDVGSMLNNFQRDRIKTSKDLKNNLAYEVKEIEHYVDKKLKEFDKSHKEMSVQMKEDLSKFTGDIADTVKKMLKEFDKNQADVSKELKKTKDIWTEMTNLQNKARKSKSLKDLAPSVKVKEKVMTVAEALEEEEASPKMDLEERVLKFINKHPKGVKVGDMEKPLGVARTRLGVIAKRLLEEGQVRKEDNLYYPL